MARHDAAWWAERVAEFEDAGDASLIARRYRITVKHLKWWRWKLGRATPKKAPTRNRPARQRANAPAQRLLPVVIASPVAPHGPLADERDVDAATIIETSRGRISVRGTCTLSAEQLAAVVAELVRGC